MNYTKKRSGRRALLRRALSLALAAALLLGQAVTAAAAAAPIEPVQAVAGEHPEVQIEGNVVRDSFGKLSGFFELALRVKTPTVSVTNPDGSNATNPDGSNATVEKAFRSLSVTLAYDPKVLAPVSWSLMPNETDGSVTPDVDLTGVLPYQKQLETKKFDTITGGVAQTGAADPTSEKALLFFNAESYKSVKFADLTTLAVIRFYVLPGANGEVFTLDDDGVTLSYGGAVVNDLTQFVDFATDAEIESSKSPAGAALWYRSEDNEFYFVPEYAKDNTKKESVSVKVGTTTQMIDAPITKNERILAKKAGETEDTTTTPATYYSYMTNLIPDGNVTSTLVSKESFAGGGVSVDKVATIIFLDWDNTILGSQIVPRKADVRKLVNDFVAANLIHPEIFATNPAVSSLARTDSYRGKYAHSAPAPAPAPGAADVTPGADKYALTNKLDYVFFKRPMEPEMIPDPTAPDPATAPLVPSGKWIQKADATNSTPTYDTQYPYTHGWAVCDTYPAAKNTWTTLGSTGELADYKVDPATGAAEFTYDSATKFALADFAAGFNPTGGAIYVKAVYEPGEELQKGFSYRMTSQPAYNKLSDAAASAGGAYEIKLEFERAVINSQDKLLRGVSRLRQPTVRQDTTPDLRWEEILDLGISHNLPNPTLEEASVLRNRTTYTKVDVDNGEAISFSLALSARQNKVDYFLTDAYGTNFVTGGQRSDSNFMQTDESFAIDNYNYYVAGESDETDNYYDTPTFGNKDGTHGFVLYGTLNNIMEKTTRLHDGDIDTIEYNKFVTEETLADANLRANTAGDLPAFDNLDAIKTALENASVAAAAHKGAADEADYWDKDLDCARLNYHQIQLYLMGQGLLSPSAADAVKLTWCHLHADCAATGSGKPTNWVELMEVADADPDQIDLLTTGEVESLFHLRDTGGALWVTTPAFKTKVVAAVAAYVAAGVTPANITWDQIQYYLDKNTADADDDGAVNTTDFSLIDTYGKEKYWWYAGGVKPADFATTLTAADVATTTSRPAALNTLKTAYDKMVAAAEDDTLGWLDWITLTENLVADATAAKFATFADFKTELQAAVTALGTSASWGDIQFYILHGTAPTVGDAAEIAGYFWHNGGRKVTNTSTLVKAAIAFNSGNTASMDAFTLSDLYNIASPGLHFRKSFAGEKYTAADFDAFKAAVCQYVQDRKSREDDWEQLQYYLINGIIPATDPIRDREAKYYWWKEGRQPMKVDFTLSATAAEERADALAEAMSDAAFRKLYNGNTVAWDDLTETILESGRLVKEYAGTEATFDAITKFGSAEVADVIAAVETLLTAKIGTTPTFPPATLTWEDIQCDLLNVAAPTDADELWWKGVGDKPSEANPPEVDFATLVTLIEAVATDQTNTTAEMALRAFLTEDIGKNIGLMGTDGVSSVTQAELNSIDWTGSLNTGALDFTATGGNCWASGSFKFTWYQMQDVILNYGTWLDNEADAILAVTDPNWMGYSITPPAWVLTMSIADFNMRMVAISLEDQLAALTTRITELTLLVKADPEQAEQYRAQLLELRAALDALLAAMDSEVPPQPDIPLIPLVPATPTTPEEPEDPSQSAPPTAPPEGEPNTPETPETPENPQEPDAPDTETPEEPEDPSQPAPPTDPPEGEPNTPETPETPELPQEPDVGGDVPIAPDTETPEPPQEPDVGGDVSIAPEPNTPEPPQDTNTPEPPQESNLVAFRRRSVPNLYVTGRWGSDPNTPLPPLWQNNYYIRAVSLWGGTPAVAWRTPPRNGFISYYRPILGIPTGI